MYPGIFKKGKRGLTPISPATCPAGDSGGRGGVVADGGGGAVTGGGGEAGRVTGKGVKGEMRSRPTFR